MDVDNKEIEKIMEEKQCDRETAWKLSKDRKENKYIENEWEKQKKHKKKLKRTEEEIEEKDKNRAEWKIKKEVVDIFRREDNERELLLDEYEVFYEDDKGKQKISTAKLGNLIYSEHGHFFTIVDNKEIYTYNHEGGYYENNGDAKIRNLVEYYLEDYVVERYKNECVGWIRDHNYVRREDINVPLHLINVQNGILNIETMKLIEHTPDLFFLSQIPIKFNPHAKCDKFIEFLNHISMKEGELREKTVNTIQEYLGYCFLRAYPYKNYIVFDGGGDNGKTTLLNVVVALIGMNNNTSISLQDLNHRPFAKAQLFRKHINVSDDLPKKALKYTGEIKQITGNSPLWSDIKNHRKGISFVNYAKPWYACNELPETYDYSDAFFSRMIQITFLNKYLPKGNKKINDKNIFVRDTKITEKLTTPEELSGIFNFALEGLERLKENHNFSDDMTTEEKRTMYLRKTNPIHAFIEDEIEIIGEDWCITVDDFFSELISYCERNEFDKPTSRKYVTSRVLDENIGVQKRQKKINGVPRVWCWIGIKSVSESTINHFLGEQKNKMII